MFAGRKGAQGPLLAARSWLFLPGSLGTDCAISSTSKETLAVSCPGLPSWVLLPYLHPESPWDIQNICKRLSCYFLPLFKMSSIKISTETSWLEREMHASCSEQLLTVQWKWNEMKTQHYYVLPGWPLPTRDRLFLCLNGSFKRS